MRKPSRSDHYPGMESVEVCDHTWRMFQHHARHRCKLNDASVKELWDLALAHRKAPDDDPKAKEKTEAAFNARCEDFGLHPTDARKMLNDVRRGGWMPRQ